MDKLLTFDRLAGRGELFRRAMIPIVWTHGAFDLLHAGHVRSLECAKLAHPRAALIVGLFSDALTSSLKPGRPIVGQVERAFLLDALAAVDALVIIDDAAAAIAALQPTVIWDGPPRFDHLSTTSILHKIQSG